MSRRDPADFETIRPLLNSYLDAMEWSPTYSPATVRRDPELLELIVCEHFGRMDLMQDRKFRAPVSLGVSVLINQGFLVTRRDEADRRRVWYLPGPRLLERYACALEWELYGEGNIRPFSKHECIRFWNDDGKHLPKKLKPDFPVGTYRVYAESYNVTLEAFPEELTNGQIYERVEDRLDLSDEERSTLTAGGAASKISAWSRQGLFTFRTQGLTVSRKKGVHQATELVQRPITEWEAKMLYYWHNRQVQKREKEEVIERPKLVLISPTRDEEEEASSQADPDGLVPNENVIVESGVLLTGMFLPTGPKTFDLSAAEHLVCAGLGLSDDAWAIEYNDSHKSGGRVRKLRKMTSKALSIHWQAGQLTKIKDGVFRLSDEEHQRQFMSMLEHRLFPQGDQEQRKVPREE